MYPLVDGKNFDLLRVFFTVLKSCSAEEEERGEGSRTVEPRPDTHLRLLQELKSPLKGEVDAPVVHKTFSVHEHQCIEAFPQCSLVISGSSAWHLPSQV